VIFDEIGSLPLAAQARIIAAERGGTLGEEELQASRALEFYERVGARRSAGEAAKLLERS
jgi:hypothetical protein